MAYEDIIRERTIKITVEVSVKINWWWCNQAALK